MKKDKNIKMYAIIMIILLILLIVPLLYIGFFNHPYSDDYALTLYPRLAYLSGGNLFDIFKAGLIKVNEMYFNWQGTYSTVFINSFLPIYISEEFYVITPYVFIFSLIISTMFFCYSLLVKYLKVNKSLYLIITSIILILQIEFILSASEGFYWWNGASHYTLFYSLYLMLLFFLSLVYKETEKRKNIVYIVLSVILSFIVAGGNYITAFFCILSLILITLLTFILKNKKWKPFLIVTIVNGIGFLINCLAPGNSVRYQEFGTGFSALKSIEYSFKYGIVKLIEWLNIPIVLGIIFIVFILIRYINKLKFKFKYPLIISIFSFCFYCTQYTPMLYSMGFLGDLRTLNIIYFSIFYLIIFNILYWYGWLYNIVKKHDNKFSCFIKNLYNNKIVIISPIVLLIISFIFIPNTYRYSTSYKAIMSLESGEAETYHLENQKRLKMYLDKSIKDVYVEEYSVKPDLLYFTDIECDEYFWQNRVLRDYYNKNNIVKICKDENSMEITDEN